MRFWIGGLLVVLAVTVATTYLVVGNGLAYDWRVWYIRFFPGRF